MVDWPSDALIDALLAEDAPGGDLTTEALASGVGAGASSLRRAAL
jgi:nicotinate-nucleotide pyrophosphorylase